jgi:hypothetical protein
VTAVETLRAALRSALVKSVQPDAEGARLEAAVVGEA